MKKITSILALFLMCFGISLQAADFTPVDGAKYLIRSVGKGVFALYDKTCVKGKNDNTVILSYGSDYKNANSLFTISGDASKGFNIVTADNSYVYAVNTENQDGNVGVKADMADDCLWKIVDNNGKWNIIPMAGENSWNCRGNFDGKNHIGQWDNNAADDNKWEIMTVSEYDAILVAQNQQKFEELTVTANGYLALQGRNVWSKPQAVKALNDAIAAKPVEGTPAEGWVKAVEALQNAVNNYPSSACEFPKNVTLKFKNRADVSQFMSVEGDFMVASVDETAAEWSLNPVEGGYNIYNISQQKYIAPTDKDKLYDQIKAVADQTAAGVYMMSTVVDGESEYLVIGDTQLGNDGNRFLHRNGAGKIVRWKSYEHATQWTVNKNTVDVVYNYELDGEVVATKTVKQITGEAFNAPALNEFVELQTPSGFVADTNEPVLVKCTEKLPFAKSADFASATWLNLNIGGFYWVLNEDKTVALSKTAVSALPEDAEKWCIVGNAVEGFSIYNKAAGAGFVLSAPAEFGEAEDKKGSAGQAIAPKMVEASSIPATDNAVWNLVTKVTGEGNEKPGYFVYQQGIESHKLNRNGGSQSLAFWSRGADNGSTVNFHTAVTDEQAIADYKANQTQVVGYVGGLTEAAFAELQGITTLPALVEFINADKTVKLVEGGFYRIKNYSRNLSVDNGQRPGEGAFMANVLNADQKPGISCQTVSMAEAGAVWKVVAVEGGYNLQNMNNGQFIGKTTKESYLQFADQAEAGLYTFVGLGDAQYQIACQNGEGAKELHASGLISKGDPGVMHYTEGMNSPSAWYLVPATSLEVNMNKVTEDATESWASLYLPFGVKLNGVEAYSGKVNGNVMNLTSVDAEVPANTGVILKGTEAKYTLTIAEVAGTVANNDLKGSNVNVAKVANSVVLGALDGVVALYSPKGEQLLANKAYAVASASAAANGLKFVFGEVTGVEGVEVETENAGAVYYDLSGRRVANPVKGIYVKNGKKVYVK